MYLCLKNKKGRDRSRPFSDSVLKTKKAAENWKDSPRLAICILQEPTGRRTSPPRSATTSCSVLKLSVSWYFPLLLNFASI